MQQSSQKKHHLSRISTSLTLIVTLCMLTLLSDHEAWALEIDTAQITMEEISPPLILLAMAAPPDFLATPSTCKVQEREKGKGITPFIGTNRALTLLPPPERPAIAASDLTTLARPEVTAGVNVNLGALNFNLGYTVPASKVDNFVRPFGVDLESGSEGKCLSLDVKIPF